MRILVLGDLVLDSVAELGQRPGDESVLSQDISIWLPAISDCCGGSALNFAVSAVKHRLMPILVGSVGDDWAGEYLLEGIRELGLEHVVEKVPGQLTGRALLGYFDDGSRVMVASKPNANDYLSASRLDALFSGPQIDAVWIPGQCICDSGSPRHQSTLRIMDVARSVGAKVIFDLVPHELYRYFNNYQELVNSVGPLDGLVAELPTARRLFGLSPFTELSEETLVETSDVSLKWASFALLRYRSENKYVQLARNRVGWWDLSEEQLTGSLLRGYGDFKACQALSKRKDGTYVWS